MSNTSLLVRTGELLSLVYSATMITVAPAFPALTPLYSSLATLITPGPGSALLSLPDINTARFDRLLTPFSTWTDVTVFDAPPGQVALWGGGAAANPGNPGIQAAAGAQLPVEYCSNSSGTPFVDLPLLTPTNGTQCLQFLWAAAPLYLSMTAQQVASIPLVAYFTQDLVMTLMDWVVLQPLLAAQAANLSLPGGPILVSASQDAAVAAAAAAATVATANGGGGKGGGGGGCGGFGACPLTRARIPCDPAAGRALPDGVCRPAGDRVVRLAAVARPPPSPGPRAAGLPAAGQHLRGCHGV